MTGPQWRASREQQVTDGGEGQGGWEGPERRQCEWALKAAYAWGAKGRGRLGTWPGREDQAGRGRGQAEWPTPGLDNSSPYATSTRQSSNASEGLQGSEGPWDMPTRGHSLVRSGHWSS